MNFISKITIISLFALTCILISPTAHAEIRPGFRVGGYFDAGAAFLGGEIDARVGEDWHFVPNAEFVFIDNGTMQTFNFDFQYDLHPRYGVNLWAGGGPAIIHVDPSNDRLHSDTDFGLNLLFGIGFPIRDARFMPYIQPKVILSGNSDFALGFGVRF